MNEIDHHDIVELYVTMKRVAVRTLCIKMYIRAKLSEIAVISSVYARSADLDCILMKLPC